jgi:hypothetical protein
MNPLYNLAIKRLGTAVSSSFSGDLTQPVTDRILGRPVVETDDAPTTQTTTALDKEVAFAKLDEYTIVDKPGGTEIEFIPHLFNWRTTCPTAGAAGSCTGGRAETCPNLAAARLLVDKNGA